LLHATVFLATEFSAVPAYSPHNKSVTRNNAPLSRLRNRYFCGHQQALLVRNIVLRNTVRNSQGIESELDCSSHREGRISTQNQSGIAIRQGFRTIPGRPSWTAQAIFATKRTTRKNSRCHSHTRR